jgi:hypothetical protein
MNRFNRTLLVLVSAALAHGQNYIRVQSGGQSYVVDAASDDVQKNLTPANPQAGEVKLPAWLFPYQGAVPVKSNYDVRTGIAEATFAAGGTVDQITTYYDQLFRSRGLSTSGAMGNPNSKIISGKNASGNISVMANNFRGAIEIRVTFAPSERKSPKRQFKAAWYDDTRGILCLEDLATGEQYYLDKRGIMEANLSRPGAVKSEDAPMPSWLPLYPGARREKISMMLDASVTFASRDSIRNIYNWYREAVTNGGATIQDSGIMKSGTPLEDFSARIVALRGDDKVEIQIGKIFQIAVFGAASQKDETGIGIRYTVPKR